MARAGFLQAPAETSFVLASASPRRLALLHQIGLIPDDVDPSEIDETPGARELPVRYAARMAAEKAGAAAGRRGAGIILAADTVVARGRRILPKPDTAKAARQCLEQLSGRRHRVLGAVTILAPGGVSVSRLVTSVVGFKRLEDDEIVAYLETGEWQGKAGGYAIQGAAAAFVRYVGGSYTNVVGLPLHETYMALRGIGFTVRNQDDRAG